MPSRISLVIRLLRLTLLPPWPTGPRTIRRLGLLLLFVPLFLLIQGIHWVGFLLDEVFFRGYRRIQIREPLFIVGLPRSGTTFLQRVYAQDTQRFTTMKLWELLFAPSVTERRFWQGLGAVNRFLGRPFSRLGRWGERRGLGWLEVIHEVALDDPEEDYFLLLPVFACFLLVVPFPYHRDVWQLARFDELPSSERRPIMDFYRAALQRHLYAVGPDKQLLSKNPSFTPFLRSLGEAFPDGRFLCCVRDPVQVVPSLLSSISAGAGLFGYDVADPRVRDRFVDMLDFFAKHAVATLDGLPENRCAFVPLGEVKKDVGRFVLDTYHRFGWEADPGFHDRLAEESIRDKKYESRHSYSLDDYGLTEADVRIRFAQLISRFGFSGGEEQPASGGDMDKAPAKTSPDPEKGMGLGPAGEGPGTPPT